MGLVAANDSFIRHFETENVFFVPAIYDRQLRAGTLTSSRKFRITFRTDKRGAIRPVVRAVDLGTALKMSLTARYGRGSQLNLFGEIGERIYISAFSLDLEFLTYTREYKKTSAGNNIAPEFATEFALPIGAIIDLIRSYNRKHWKSLYKLIRIGSRPAPSFHWVPSTKRTYFRRELSSEFSKMLKLQLGI